jgi:hypothetical protein
MSQFFENFNGATAGQAHPDFALEFGSAAQVVEAGNPLAESDSSLRINWVSGDFLRSAISWLVGTTSGKTTVRFLGTFDNHTGLNPGQIVGPILSGSGTSDANKSGYTVWYGSNFRLSKYDAGTESEVGSASGLGTAGVTSRYIEIIRDGALIEVRSWDIGGSRPAAADISYTDPSPLAVAGFFGISALLRQVTGDVVDTLAVHEISAANDGDALPTGPVANNPTLRKGSQFTVETTLAGTVTSATLNGNAITVDSHVGTTVTLTDSDATIATSGTYNLVLTDDAAATETISVQVNVVGLPTNTARKDGGLLVSLTDLTLDAVNSSGTVVKQLTGITTDASGIISAIDLSDISEAIGDTLKVSLHSATSDVGVTFEQALEAI